MYYPDYHAFAQRLHQALHRRSIGLPLEHLINDLSRYFSSADLDLLDAVNEERDVDWHYVRLYPEVPRLGGMDPINSATSLLEAVACVITVFDDMKLYPDAVMPTPDGILFKKDGVALSRVGRISFAEVSPEMVKRCTSLMKGIHKGGDDTRLMARLAELPGFAGKPLAMLQTRPARSLPGMMLSLVESMPQLLREMLKAESSVEVSHTLAADLVAELAGLKDWQVLRAKLDKWKGSAGPVIIAIGEQADRESAYSFYRNAASGLGGFSEMLRLFDGVSETASNRMLTGHLRREFLRYSKTIGRAEIQYGGDCLEGRSLYLTYGIDEPDNGFEFLNMRELPACISYPEVEPTLVDACSGSLAEIAGALARALGLGGNIHEQIEMTNARQGWSSLELQDLLFTKEAIHGTDYLQVSRLDANGRYHEVGDRIALYKAMIGDGDIDLLWLKADYGNSSVCRLDHLLDEEVEQLETFTGLVAHPKLNDRWKV